jgi:hypothetical protein
MFAGIVKANNILPGTFPSSMLPHGPYERDRRPQVVPQHKSKLWKGSVTELALRVEADHKAGKITVNGVKVKSRDAAFQWASEHYHRASEKPFTAHSLRVSLKRWHDKATGKI